MFHGKTHYTWPCSIAILNITKGYFLEFHEKLLLFSPDDLLAIKNFPGLGRSLQPSSERTPGANGLPFRRRIEGTFRRMVIVPVPQSPGSFRMYAISCSLPQISRI